MKRRPRLWLVVQEMDHEPDVTSYHLVAGHARAEKLVQRFNELGLKHGFEARIESELDMIDCTEELDDAVADAQVFIDEFVSPD